MLGKTNPCARNRTTAGSEYSTRRILRDPVLVLAAPGLAGNSLKMWRIGYSNCFIFLAPGFTLPKDLFPTLFFQHFLALFIYFWSLGLSLELIFLRSQSQQFLWTNVIFTWYWTYGFGCGCGWGRGCGWGCSWRHGCACVVVELVVVVEVVEDVMVVLVVEVAVEAGRILAPNGNVPFVIWRH